MASTTAALTASRPGASLELNKRFAVGMAVAMFLVNFAGFVPTFFLRPFFDVPQIPLYLYLHGVVGTAWFALVVTQAVLIANRQFTRHRQLGWIGVGLGVVLIGLGVYTSTHMVPRNAAAHPLSAADIELYGVRHGGRPGRLRHFSDARGAGDLLPPPRRHPHATDADRDVGNDGPGSRENRELGRRLRPIIGIVMLGLIASRSSSTTYGRDVAFISRRYSVWCSSIGVNLPSNRAASARQSWPTGSRTCERALAVDQSW